jgi:PAS domain S-box-containing protein
MANGGKETILIVEDDAGIAELERMQLERAGFQAVTTPTAGEALELLARHQIALILLDYRLPDNQSGLDFYAQVKAAGRDVPVIMVTGFSDEATVIQALRAGVRDFVTKSIEYLDYLPEAVERVLRQVRTEHRLAESEARLASVINSANDAILVIGEDRSITLFNTAAERMFRCPAARAIGQPVNRFLPGDWGGIAPTMTERSGPAVEENQPPALSDSTFLLLASSLQRGVRADGEEFPLEASVSRSRAAGREFLTVVVRDVTERRRAEARLREQAALLDKANDVILVQDMDERIVFWNRRAERLYGWTAAEAQGRNAREFLFREASPEWDEALRTVREKEEWSGELRQVTRDGKDITVASRWTLVRDEEGRPKSSLVINTDITEKKKLEVQFLRAQRLESIGTLAGGIAHDLNNVLTPILMGVDLLLLRTDDATNRAILATLRESTERGAEMVRQVLSIARGAEGQRGALPLPPLLAELGKLLRQTFPKSIDIQVSAPRELWLVHAEATHIHQVLMNLCVNARDAMPAGGWLSLGAQNVLLDKSGALTNVDARPGPYVLLAVEDTGTGIPTTVIDKIFDPFFTTKEVAKGTGLGLSTVLGIVKSHGGFINVYSEVGKGTRFSVYLPALVTATAARREEQPVELPTGAGELILVVDDETSVRAVTTAILEASGYRVMPAQNGAEALALYQQHREEIRAVLTDMMMPVLDGPATIAALVQLGCRVPILAASGPASARPPPESIPGVRATLAKPFSAEKLVRAVAEVLKKS